MVHSFQSLLLSIHSLIRFFFVNMAFEVILMIWFPRLRTHITEVLPTGAGHKVTPHRPFHSFPTPRTDLSISRNPFSISFLRYYLLTPPSFLIAFARVMVVTLTPETKDLSTTAFDSINIELVNFNAISTINSRTELIVTIFHNQKLANSLPPFF